MDLSRTLISSKSPWYQDSDVTPTKHLPLTPPSTETSTPCQTSDHCAPQHDDLMYISHQLWSGSQEQERPTGRFSYENPTWPDEERSLFDTPLLGYQFQDDDATIVSYSTCSQSRCSQTTLCGSLSPAEQKDSAFHTSSLAVVSSSRLPSCTYDKALPPTPSMSRPDSLRWFEDPPTRSRKCSLTGSSISSPMCTRQASSSLDNASSLDPFPVVGDRVQSWPTFVAQREAPKPPVVEEKSVWESDSEDDEQPDTIGRFRRRISNPLRAFLCSGKEPRRKSA